MPQLPGVVGVVEQHDLPPREADGIDVAPDDRVADLETRFH